ncbi:MAG: YggT family protein [bacterium]
MYTTLIKSLDYVFNILIVLFIMKLVIDPRDFFFNSALRPVDAITDPILTQIRKLVNFNRHGKDYLPLIAIIVLIPLYILAYWQIPVYQKEFIQVGSRNLTILQAVSESMGRLLIFMIQFMAFGFFVFTMTPAYSRNPISGFFQDIVVPFGSFFRKNSNTSSKKTFLPMAGVVIFLLGLITTVLLQGLVASSLSDYIASWKTWIHPVFFIAVKALSIHRFLVFLLVLAVIFSWLDLEARNSIVSLVYMLTEPILLPIRRIVSPVGDLDLSPWLASIAIWFSGKILIEILNYLERLIVA